MEIHYAGVCAYARSSMLQLQLSIKARIDLVLLYVSAAFATINQVEASFVLRIASAAWGRN